MVAPVQQGFCNTAGCHDDVNGRIHLP
jgi:hypothetical protein